MTAAASTASVKSIRALERGLDVLQALQTGPAGLKTLHEITGLPKATLLRILRTLTERNLIWRRMDFTDAVEAAAVMDGAPGRYSPV